MSYFPFFMEIGGAGCLVVGGGTVALRKAEKLLPFGARITAVAPSFCAGFEKLAGVRKITRAFLPGDVEGMLFVIGAADDAAVNAEVSRLCRERGIPVNIVDDREKCTFLFPALVKRGEFAVGISTGGNSPLAARYLREKIEESIPPRCGEAVALLGALRETVKENVPDSRERERVFRRLFEMALVEDITAEALGRLLEGGHDDGQH